MVLWFMCARSCTGTAREDRQLFPSFQRRCWWELKDSEQTAVDCLDEDVTTEINVLRFTHIRVVVIKTLLVHAYRHSSRRGTLVSAAPTQCVGAQLYPNDWVCYHATFINCSPAILVFSYQL